jgi:hypothetical protein
MYRELSEYPELVGVGVEELVAVLVGDGLRGFQEMEYELELILASAAFITETKYDRFGPT